MIGILNLEILKNLSTDKLKIKNIDGGRKNNENKEFYTIDLEENKRYRKIKHKVSIYDSNLTNDLLHVEASSSKKTEELESFIDKLILELKNEPKNRIKFLFHEKEIKTLFFESERSKITKMTIELISYAIAITILINIITNSIIVMSSIFIYSVTINAVLIMVIKYGCINIYHIEDKKLFF